MIEKKTIIEISSSTAVRLRPAVAICHNREERERIIDLCIQAGLSEWNEELRGLFIRYPNIRIMGKRFWTCSNVRTIPDVAEFIQSDLIF